MKGGTISAGGEGILVAGSGAEVNIESGNISGESRGLSVSAAGKVTLSGGTFSSPSPGTAVFCYTGKSVGSILKENFAYKQDGCWVSDTSAGTLTGTVTVAKAPIQSVSISSDTTTTITYGDTAPTLTATAILAASMAVTYQWYQDGVAIENATSSTYTPGELDAGSYDYTCKATADGYSLTSAAVEVNVEQKELELAITGTTTKTYDGTTDGPAGLSIETKNRVSGDDVTVTAVSYTYNSANVEEAKTITANGVTLSGAAASNYKLPEGPITIGGTITKSQPTITFKGPSIVSQYGQIYTDAGLRLTLNVSGASEDDVEFTWTDSEQKPLKDAPTDAGTYTVTATIPATDNRELATASVTVTIEPKPVSNPTITLEKGSYEYDGTEKKPIVKVFDGDTEIDPKEYTVTYTNNVNVGTDATVTITGAEGGNYEVSGSTTFEITKPDLSTATVTLSQTSFTYDGTEHKPAVTVEKNGRTLEENTDYTLTYAENTNAGTATVTVTAVENGNYSGSNSKTFEIKQADISSAVVTLTGTLFEYIGGTLEIGVQSVVLNDSKLTYGTDYTYSGQTGQDAGTYTVTVEGQGNYTGTATATWEIYQKELTVGNWTIEKAYDGTTDFTLDAEDAVLYDVCYSDDVKLDVSGVTVQFADADVGENKSVTYTGSFALTGSAAKNYTLKYQPILTGTITKRPISVTPDSLTKEYGTSDPALTYEITSGSLLDGHTLFLSRVSGEDIGSYVIRQYTIQDADGNDVTGNYDVTLKVVNFQITKPDLATATVTLTLPDGGYTYDGNAKTPDVTVKKNGKTLAEDTDYTVAYAGNVNAGTATVTVTAVENGNYAGSQTVEFKIEKATPDLGTVGYTGTIYPTTALKDITLTRTKETVSGTLSLDADQPLAVGEGTYTWTFTPDDADNYNEVTGTVTMEVTKDSLTGISIGTTAPNKTDYVYEDAFDPTGLTVTAIYASGGTADVTGKVTFSALSAGDTAIELSYTEDGVTKTCTVDGITVAKKQLDVSGMSWNVGTYTYNGTAQGPALEGTLPAGVTVTTTDDAKTDAGTYTAKAEFTLADGYSDVNYEITGTNPLTAEWTIAQRTAELTWSNTSLTYNGTAQQPAAAVSNLIAGDACTVTVDGAQTDVGSYTAMAVGLSNSNYKLPDDAVAGFTIGAKDITVNITPNGGVYGSTITPATAELIGVVEGDTVPVTLTYTGTANDGTEVDSTEVPALAGTYTVTADIADGNYNLTDTVTADFVVTRANAGLSVSPNKADMTYGDAAFTLTASHNGNGAVTYASGNTDVATVNADGTVTLHNTGEAVITVTLAQTDNYEGGEITVTITVARKNDTLKVEQLTYTVTYGDADFTIGYETESGSKAAFASSDPSVATVDANGKVHIVGVGTATITLKTEQSQNYNAVSENVTVVVAQKPVTVTADDKSKIYGEADPALTYTASGVLDGDNLNIPLHRAAGEDVGEYDITADQTNANPNYKIEFVPGKMTVTPRTAVLAWSDTAFVYDGQPHQPAAEVSNLLPGDACTVTVTGAQTNAGSYTAEAAALSNDNYNLPEDVKATFTIAQKALAWVADLAAAKAQTDEGEAAVYGKLELSGVAEGETIAFAGKWVTSGLAGVTAPGEYTVQVEPADGSEWFADVTQAVRDNYVLPEAPTVTAAVNPVTVAPTLPPEVTNTDTTHFKVQLEQGISDVPKALAEQEHLNTPEKIETHMKVQISQANAAIPQENTAVYDVALMVSTDSGQTWQKATAENFPSGGLTVTLPYPEGTDSRYRFTAAHMFTTSDFGKTPGNVEYPAVTNTAEGIRFTVTGLSPISLGWQEPEPTPTPDATATPAPDATPTPAPTATPAPGATAAPDATPAPTEAPASEPAASTAPAPTAAPAVAATGDSSHPVLWLALLVLAAAAMVGLTIYKRRKRDR